MWSSITGGVTPGKQNLTDSVRKNLRQGTPGSRSGDAGGVSDARCGAVEMRVHRFHHPNAESTEPMGEAKFIHFWQNTNGKITRVIRYDHVALPR
jgi:hypothetical protein